MLADRETPSGGLGTDGGAGGHWQREWGTQVQGHETGKGMMCSGNYWSTRFSGQNLEVQGVGRHEAGAGGENRSPGAVFHGKELGFYLVRNERH